MVCTAASNPTGVITSGGGFSTYFPAPSFQAAAVSQYLNTVSPKPAAGYNAQGRAYPDVALLATYYPVVINGQNYDLFGTSASSPLMAAMVSLLNAARYANGLGTVGWLNPTLYSAASTYYNDVTSGNNNCCSQSYDAECCKAGFSAARGWDAATGFGSIDYDNLMYMFGTTQNNFPTFAPTVTPGVPTTSPTIAPLNTGYFINTIASSCSGTADYMIVEGYATNTCIYAPGAQGSTQSYMNIWQIDELFSFGSVYQYTTPNCTGDYTIVESGSIPSSCDNTGGTTKLFQWGYLDTSPTPWASFQHSGLVTLQYDSEAECLSPNASASVSSFSWLAADTCLNGFEVSCAGAGYSVTEYTYSSCTGATLTQDYEPGNCNAESPFSDDQATYYYQVSKLATNLTTECIMYNSSPDSNDDNLTPGEVAGTIIGCLAGVALAGALMWFCYFKPKAAAKTTKQPLLGKSDHYNQM